MDTTLAIRGRRIVTPSGVRAGVVRIVGERIAGFVAEPAPTDTIVDAGDDVVMPALVDAHVHINEPGHTDWEGFATATRAAAAGGIGTLVDMPLNSVPVTTTPEALGLKAAAAAGASQVDYAFWGGATGGPGETDAIETLHAAGVAGFKCFLCPSGLPEFPALPVDRLERTLARIAAIDSVLLVHAEAPDVLERAASGANLAAAPRSYARYLQTRPVEAEIGAVERLLAAAAATGARLHIVHVSAAETVACIEAARAAGVRVTAETCPHYLVQSAGDIADGATLWKCAPLIRDQVHREGLWRALERRGLDLIASDHSPCPPALKALEEGSFAAAWGGIAGLELTLPLVWTEARRRGIGLPALVEWLRARPADLAGLAPRKGRLAIGADADVVIWDDAAAWTIDPDRLHQRHASTPYAGRRVVGAVRTTIVRGRIVYDRGAFPGSPEGTWVRGRL